MRTSQYVFIVYDGKLSRSLREVAGYFIPNWFLAVIEHPIFQIGQPRKHQYINTKAKLEESSVLVSVPLNITKFVSLALYTPLKINADEATTPETNPHLAETYLRN